MIMKYIPINNAQLIRKEHVYFKAILAIRQSKKRKYKQMSVMNLQSLSTRLDITASIRYYRYKVIHIRTND